ncbi:hypothetical protein GCM10027565_27960 [Bordetella tumulicola]
MTGIRKAWRHCEPGFSVLGPAGPLRLGQSRASGTEGACMRPSRVDGPAGPNTLNPGASRTNPASKPPLPLKATQPTPVLETLSVMAL